MSERPSTMQQLIQDHRDRFNGTPAQHHLLRCLARCRTAAAGTHRWQCTACHHVDVVYNSCRNRHCPLCQSGDRSRWVRKRTAELLPVVYFHVVCTVPQQLHDLARVAPAFLYDLLMVASRQAIADLTRDPKHLGAEVGQIQVLHTWGRDLRLHPHVHSIVTGGGLTDDGNWRDCRRNRKRKKPFLVPVRCLSDRFRTLVIAGLQQAYRHGRFKDSDIDCAATPENWQAFIGSLWSQRWITYAKRPFGSAEQALRYLGRYTHRVAVTDARLSDYDGESVTLHWWDHCNGTKRQTRLTAQQFLQRFVRHQLPHGFRRLRMAGFLAPRVRQQRLEQARKLLVRRRRPAAQAAPQADRQEARPQGERRCSACGQGIMLVALIIRPVRGARPAVLVPRRWREQQSSHDMESSDANDGRHRAIDGPWPAHGEPAA